jgi:transposase
MAMTMVETRPITGGVDTHLDSHVAAALDANGGVLGVESFPTTPAGYQALHAWLVGFGQLARIGIEGTGAYGVGLSRCLQAAGVEVVEVDRPNRQARRRDGKSDPLDAVEAARAVLSGRARVLAKSADGPIEAMRALLVARRSARDARISFLNQIRHLGFTAPDDLRERLRPVTRAKLGATAAGLRPDLGSDVVTYATTLAMGQLGQRVVLLDDQLDAVDDVLGNLVTDTAPGLLEVPGVGVLTAAMLLVTAGDNAGRIHSEAAFAHLCGVAPVPASSGKVTRYRLNRGGNRQANHALWRIVFTRMSHDARTRDYVQRRLEEGLTKAEVMRVLKRYVAREIYRYLPRI